MQREVMACDELLMQRWWPVKTWWRRAICLWRGDDEEVIASQEAMKTNHQRVQSLWCREDGLWRGDAKVMMICEWQKVDMFGAQISWSVDMCSDQLICSVLRSWQCVRLYLIHAQCETARISRSVLLPSSRRSSGLRNLSDFDCFISAYQNYNVGKCKIESVSQGYTLNSVP